MAQKKYNRTETNNVIMEMKTGIKQFKQVVVAKNDEQKVLLKTISRNIITFVKGSPGTGKCINPENSYISTTNGIQLFSDLVPEHSDKDAYHEKTYTVINRDGLKENASHIYDSGIQDTKIITTKLGYSIEGTLNHRILCMTPEGIKWKRLEDIRTTDVACISRKQEFEDAHETKNEIDRAYFMGLMLGDGCYVLKNTFSLSSIDSEIIEFFYKFCNNNFDYVPKQSKSRYCDHVVCNKQARNELLEWGLLNIKGEHKTIPSNLLNSSKQVIAALLRGLFDTDGCVEKKSAVTFLNKSIKMCKQIQNLLLRLGIVSSFRIKTKSYKGERRSYGYISVIASSLKDFRDIVGFNVLHKKERLNYIVDNTERNTNIDTIPKFYGSVILSQYVNAFNLNAGDFQHYTTGNRAVSHDKLSSLYEKHRVTGKSQQIEEILDTRYFYDPIVSVTDSSNRVCDFVVPDSHSFVANGFVNHNTFLAVTYGLQRLLAGQTKQLVFTRPAVEAAGEKLGYLPGDLNEKISPYMIPIFDAVTKIIPPEMLDKLMKKNGHDAQIKMIPLAYMRGLTFDNSFVICDEFQNSTPEQMRMLLTRIGENSQMVICGDVDQSDIQGVNGMEDAFYLLKEIAGVGFVSMTEQAIVRNPIIQEIDGRYKQRLQKTFGNV